MKKKYCLLLLCFLLASCSGQKTVKQSPMPVPPAASSKPAPATNKPAEAPNEPAQQSTPNNTTQSSVPSANPSTSPANEPIGDAAVGDNSKKPGGYYLDDGPDANPPANIDDIPNAAPKKEPLLTRANKPYKALGIVYTPMTTSQNYKERGLASWYGKRFHGKKTSSGEIYDMYSMSAAHTTLPLPSYAKVTNPANGRFVIVRINDRGPFKSTRIIDLSYAAAYKLRLITKGSGLVEVETIHADQVASAATSQNSGTVAAKSNGNPVSEVIVTATPVPTTGSADDVAILEYFIQAGAFKSEANAEALMEKIKGLDIEQNTGFNRVYNSGLHRLKIGPYTSRQEADQVAATIRKQLNVSAIIINQ